MLQVFIIALYALIVRLIQRPYIQRIKNNTGLNNAIAVRKKYKIVRNLSIIIFFIINLFIVALINKNANYVDVIMTSFTVTITSYFLTSGGIFAHKEFNKINFLSIKDFEKVKGNFSLYLRGFNVDDYSSKYDVSQIKEHQFSEYTLARLLGRGSPLFAVGMTKELVSPEGANRIYLSDETWKNDVKTLMNKASTIYILINGNDSCVWEIIQSMTMLEKTCFIVDNFEQYEIVKAKLGDEYKLPNFVDSNIFVPFAFRLFPSAINNDKESFDDAIFALVFQIENTEKGYADFINDLYGKKIIRVRK